MIVLDTNVISELMKPVAVRSIVVFDWLRPHPPEQVFTTAISLAEVLAGLVILPTGKRRDALLAAAQRIFTTVFHHRILPFDEPAASAYAEIVAVRRESGGAIEAMDFQIAAIVKSRRMAVATRNAVDFVHCGIEVIDPWA